MFGTAGSLLLGSAVGAGATIHAGNKAASAQKQGAQQATDAQLQMFNQARADQAPWRAAGVQALGQLQGFMGLPVTGGQSASQAPSNPGGPVGNPMPSANSSPSMQNAFGGSQFAPIGSPSMSAGPSRSSAYNDGFGGNQTSMYGLRNNPLEPMINPVGPQQNALLKIMADRKGIQPRLLGGPVRKGGLYSFAEDGNPEAFVDMRGRATPLRGPGVMRAPTNGAIVPNPQNVTPMPQVGRSQTLKQVGARDPRGINPSTGISERGMAVRGQIDAQAGRVVWPSNPNMGGKPAPNIPAAPTPVAGAPGGAMQGSGFGDFNAIHGTGPGSHRALNPNPGPGFDMNMQPISPPVSAPQPTPMPQVQPPTQTAPPSPPNAPQVDPQDSLNTFLDSINYKFLEDRGQNALTRLMASGGLQGSGRMLEAGMDLNQNMAHSRAIMPYMNQLNLIAGLGQNATMQGGNQAMQMGGVMGQNALNAGNARASSYQNTGNALGNLINQGAQLYGMQQGGYFNQPPAVPIGSQWSAGGGFSPYGP